MSENKHVFSMAWTKQIQDPKAGNRRNLRRRCLSKQSVNSGKCEDSASTVRCTYVLDILRIGVDITAFPETSNSAICTP